MFSIACFKRLAKLASPILVSSLIFPISGCGGRTLIQQPGTVFVIDQPLKGVKVLAPDSSGNLVGSVADIPAGTEAKFPKAAAAPPATPKPAAEIIDSKK